MSQRQVAMVMDLNKCLGCQTCTVACKRLWTKRDGMAHMLWNTVNTQPGTGTPHGYESMGGGFKNGEPQPGHRPSVEEYGKAWNFNHKEVAFGGNPALRLQADDGHVDGVQSNKGPNWDEDLGAGEHPNSHYFYLPRICNHCTHPACLAACPRNAINKREEDGIVLIDEGRCRGYRFCQEACPYKKIYYNEVEGVSQKCIFCFPRIDEGVTTACSRQCPGRVRFVGYLDDPAGPIHKLVHQYKVALPLHAEYGTQPNVFYVPPLSPPRLDEEGNPVDEPRIPTDYLISLFGPRVVEVLDHIKQERERVQRGETSELLDLLISRKWLDLFGPFTKHPRDVLQPRKSAQPSQSAQPGEPKVTEVRFYKKGERA